VLVEVGVEGEAPVVSDYVEEPLEPCFGFAE